VYGAVKQWRRIENRFEFEVGARAARLFGGQDVLSFEVSPTGVTLDELAAHLDRLLR
jgi:hypothetical protein